VRGGKEPLMSECYVEDFNALYAALVDGAITEAEFRRNAVSRFGYTDAEISLIAHRIRKRRPSDAPQPLPCGRW
jgi:hypothetical protein